MNRSMQSARERWERIIEDQRHSGLPVARFCREHGLAASSLFAWKRRLAREAILAGTPAFVRVQTGAGVQGENAASFPQSAMELHLGGGRHIVLRPGFDPATLAAAQAVLEGR